MAYREEVVRAILEAFKEVENTDARVGRVFLNPAEMQEAFKSEAFDRCAARVILEGLTRETREMFMGWMFNVAAYQTNKVPPKHIIVQADDRTGPLLPEDKPWLMKL